MLTHFLKRNNRRFSIGESSSSPILDVTTNLVNAWPGNGNLIDRIGANNGVAQGGLTYALGLSGYQSISENGSTSYGQTFSSYNNPQTYSLSCWFKTTSSGPFIAFTNTTSPGGSLNDRSFGIDASGNIYFYTYPGSVQILYSTGTSYSDGTWHNVVVTTSNTVSVMYIDGNFVSTINTGGGYNYTGYWLLGYASNTAGMSGGQYYNGLSQDIRYYNAIVTPLQVTQIYKNGPRIS